MANELTPSTSPVSKNSLAKPSLPFSSAPRIRARSSIASTSARLFSWNRCASTRFDRSKLCRLLSLPLPLLVLTLDTPKTAQERNRCH